MKKAALPVGILLVGFGGVLLFIAFHNLPANVTNMGDLLAWLQARISKAETPAPAAGGTP